MCQTQGPRSKCGPPSHFMRPARASKAHNLNSDHTGSICIALAEPPGNCSAPSHTSAAARTAARIARQPRYLKSERVRFNSFAVPSVPRSVNVCVKKKTTIIIKTHVVFIIVEDSKGNAAQLNSVEAMRHIVPCKIPCTKMKIKVVFSHH